MQGALTDRPRRQRAPPAARCGASRMTTTPCAIGWARQKAPIEKTSTASDRETGMHKTDRNRSSDGYRRLGILAMRREHCRKGEDRLAELRRRQRKNERPKSGE